MTTDVRDGAWMTYGQLADRRQITRRAAIRLAQRHRWRREKGNDGFARVFVPDVMTTPRGDDTATIDAPHDDDTTTTAAFETALAAIEAAHARELATLKEQVANAEAARIAMQALVQQFAGQMHDADEAFKLERERAAATLADLQHDLDTARQEALDAAATAKHADEARRSLSRLRRVLAAWRGM